MPVDWDAVQKALYPIKDYDDLSRRWRESFAYPFVRETYNISMPELAHYTVRILGGDIRNRYANYVSALLPTITQLDRAGVRDVLHLKSRIETRQQLEVFAEQSGINAQHIAEVLKYMVYWFIPMEKHLSGLVRDDPLISEAIKVLHGLGVRTNLELLQQGITGAGRRELADFSGLPEAVILELVNRADFSRMPWASKATISNIIGAGYGSLAKLASAGAEQLYADFFRYGDSIGKNLKFGNEIESSHRIAKIVPALLQDD